MTRYYLTVTVPFMYAIHDGKHFEIVKKEVYDRISVEVIKESLFSAYVIHLNRKVLLNKRWLFNHTKLENATPDRQPND